MGALVGFVVGYFLGTRAGREGVDDLRDAWKTISASQEFQGLRATAMSMIGVAMKQGVASKFKL
ncbi:MAG: hypothetical protein ACRDJW_21580 [Thermomicrobiales bacterium]